VFDLDAYLERIDLRGRPSLAEVHRAHVTSIPFENLDPQRGVPVSLEVDDLERKLISLRRGGYCFEQNLLLKAGLEALGAEVEIFLARVRIGGIDPAMRPRSHLVLGVRTEQAFWHADVGFGSASLLEPLPFGPGPAHEQSGWRFRIVEDGPELVMQLEGTDGWTDLYGFVPEPVPLIDVQTSNWFTCTHPRSPFVAGLLTALRAPDGSLTLLSDWNELALIEQTPTERTVTRVARDAVPELLATRLGLPGFVLGADGRLVLATAA
jgi:N-hydroxyarylamine O-acetyltransferase